MERPFILPALLISTLAPLAGCAVVEPGRATCEETGAAASSGHGAHSGIGSGRGGAPFGAHAAVQQADCRRGCDFPPCAIPAPPGTYVNEWNDAQIAAPNRNDFLISRHEWFSGEDELGPEALRHVAELPALMSQCPEPVVIEAAAVEIGYDETYEEALARTSQLNVARRDVVVQNLLSRGVADADQRVIVDDVDRIGVYGVEAPRVYTGLLRGGQRGRGGQGGFGGGGSGGGFGGGGFGGGGGGGGGFY